LQSSRQQWTPRPYQWIALKKILTQGPLGLLMKPGLGKTSVSLAAFSILKGKGLVNKMLVIAPLRPVYKVWPDEIKKWDNFNHLSYTIVHGPNKHDNLQEDVDVYIINPEGLKWLFTVKHLWPEWDVLCVDESTKFKNNQSQRFKMLRNVVHQFRRRWILTGSPRPNTAMDLFSQIYILDQGAALGSYITHYRKRYFSQDPYTGEWEIVGNSFDEICDKIAPLTVNVAREGNLDMPELVEVTMKVDLPPEARKAYTEVETNFYTMLENNEVVAANAAAAGVKCRQIANGAVYYMDESGEKVTKEWYTVHNAKLDALADLIEQLQGEPLLLLYEFDHDRQRIMARFEKDYNIECITGKGMEVASDMIDRFNAGRIEILLGHPASMGHGLNLQGNCTSVCWFGITWNFEHYEQAIARVWRQGQTGDRVFVYHIMAEGTLDPLVYERVLSKEAAQIKLMDALKERHDRGI
jgi:SNF2 family DNA or RNA helicase